MDKEVYYFSGTGNSLVAARAVSRAIGARMLAIPSLMGEDVIESGAATIGIVFPVYNKGMPSIVERFIGKMCDLEGKYVFGICTYGHAPCLAIRYLEKAIGARGGRLAAGFAVRMPYNYLVPSASVLDFFGSFTLEQVPAAAQGDLISDAYRKLGHIGEYVLSRREGIHETSNEAVESLSDALGLKGSLQRRVWLRVAGFKGKTDLPHPHHVRVMDCGFSVDAECIRCGTCRKICPVGNVALGPGGPSWLHRCEQCFACLQWCPKGAIQFRGRTRKCKRYHHPDAEMADMLIWKRNGVKKNET